MMYVVLLLMVFIAASTGAHLLGLLLAAVHALKPYPYRHVKDFTPPVSILKPIRGLNTGDEDNFRSFFRIDYPTFELLFLIHEDAGDDPAIPTIKKLIEEFPGVDARIIRTTRQDAVHEKVNNYLEGIEKSRYDIIFVTDADVYVEPGYLKRDLRPLSDPTVGLVTSPQTMNDFRCSGAAFEGLIQNFDGVVYWIGMRTMRRLSVIYGHSVLYRKADFYRLKADKEVKDHLIDDRAMGIAFVDKGAMRIELSERITPTRYTVTTWKKAAAHMLRWRHFYRIYSPVGTLAMVMYYMFFWGLLALGLSFLVPTSATVVGLSVRTLGIAFGAGGAALRFLCVFFGTLIAGAEKRDVRFIWTLLPSEAYAIYAHVACFFERKFEHAGRTYRIVGDRMKRAER